MEKQAALGVHTISLPPIAAADERLGGPLASVSEPGLTAPAGFAHPWKSA
jgi:hypothetical protein